MSMRDEDEIHDQVDRAEKRIDAGKTYNAMSYEEGVRDALLWGLGENEDAPLTEDDE